MIVKILKKEDVVYLSYNDGVSDVEKKFDYSAIELIIDYVMENSIEDLSVEPNLECQEYVDLMQSIFEKIKTDDFKKCFEETKSDDEE